MQRLVWHLPTKFECGVELRLQRHSLNVIGFRVVLRLHLFVYFCTLPYKECHSPGPLDYIVSGLLQLLMQSYDVSLQTYDVLLQTHDVLLQTYEVLLQTYDVLLQTYSDTGTCHLE